MEPSDLILSEFANILANLAESCESYQEIRKFSHRVDFFLFPTKKFVS